MNIDWNACAHFKGTNQKPLWLVEGRGLFRPTIQRIASYIAKNTDLDAVVLRSHSHPNGDDLRWYDYLNAMKSNPFFSTGEYGCVKYKGKACCGVVHHSDFC